MRRFLMLMVVGLLATAVVEVSAQEVFINELHYDNASTDVGEFVEIAGPAGTDLAGWTVELYNGSKGEVYGTINLAGVLPDQSLGGGTLSFPYAGIQNGSPDGMALVNPGGGVLIFISYEGTLTAVDGPANGMLSVDIGVSEPSSTPVGESLYLVDVPTRGQVYGDFTWIGPLAESPGAVNPGQVLPVEMVSFTVE